jgi:hypothetical protein
MGSETGGVYLMQDDEDGEWLSPTPADVAVTEALRERTDLDADAIDTLDSYVDLGDLRAVLGDDRSEPLSFPVEGHEVTIDADGEITID